MIVMLSKIRVEIQGLSPSFSVDRLEGLELLRLWEVVELATALVDTSNLVTAPDEAVTEPIVEEANS